uniref:Uncharacterized protein n=1 Tax=Oryza brachyantha TaxID=4533 RepID=J3MKK9_ORYBR
MARILVPRRSLPRARPSPARNRELTKFSHKLQSPAPRSSEKFYAFIDGAAHIDGFRAVAAGEVGAEAVVYRRKESNGGGFQRKQPADGGLGLAGLGGKEKTSSWPKMNEHVGSVETFDVHMQTLLRTEKRNHGRWTTAATAKLIVRAKESTNQLKALLAKLLPAGGAAQGAGGAVEAILSDITAIV